MLDGIQLLQYGDLFVSRAATGRCCAEVEVSRSRVLEIAAASEVNEVPEEKLTFINAILHFNMAPAEKKHTLLHLLLAVR